MTRTEAVMAMVQRISEPDLTAMQEEVLEVIPSDNPYKADVHIIREADNQLRFE